MTHLPLSWTHTTLPIYRIVCISNRSGLANRSFVWFHLNSQICCREPPRCLNMKCHSSQQNAHLPTLFNLPDNNAGTSKKPWPA